MSSQFPLFATRGDMLLVCSAVEGRYALDYARAVRYPSERVSRFGKVAEIPSFGVARHGSATACDQFLVTKRGNPMRLREAGFGGVGYVLEQLLNEDSVVMAPGGRWGEDVVISGKFGTIWESPFSKKLMGVYRRSVRAHFQRVRSFWVGPEAARMLDAGKRLTMSVDSPAVYDLKR